VKRSDLGQKSCCHGRKMGLAGRRLSRDMVFKAPVHLFGRFDSLGSHRIWLCHQNKGAEKLKTLALLHKRHIVLKVTKRIRIL
jgi:hypothetical protein